MAGDAIPIGARVFSVVDAFDAITTDRPYSSARSYADASAWIVEANGSHFDPEVVEAFRETPFEESSEAAARHGTVLRRA